MALLLSKRLLPANPPLSIHIALSFILSLWQIIGSSKVAIPNCLYTHNSSPSIQATVHPSILPPSHSFLLFSFSLSLPPVSLVVVYYSDSHSHISTLSGILWQAVIEKGAHTHTHAEGQNPNKLLSDLWQLLRVKKRTFLLFYNHKYNVFITFIFPKTDLLFLYLLFVCLCACTGVIECTRAWRCAQRGVWRSICTELIERKRYPGV